MSYPSKASQIEALTKTIHLNFDCPEEFAKSMAEFLFEEGYRKVIEGKWIKDKTQERDDGETYDYCCSICGFGAIPDSCGNCSVFTKYCHGCGAVMSTGD